MNVQDVSNFAPVACICGRTAVVKTKLEIVNERPHVAVTVSCDHASSYEAFSQTARYAPETIRDHMAAASPIAPLGGANLGQGLKLKPKTAKLAGVSLDAASQNVGFFLPVNQKTATFLTASGPVNYQQEVSGWGRSRAFPQHVAVEALALGDVLVGPFGRLRAGVRAVVLSKISRPNKRTKVTARAIPTDEFVSFECADHSTSVLVVADAMITAGDPDEWADAELRRREDCKDESRLVPLSDPHSERQRRIVQAGFVVGDLVQSRDVQSRGVILGQICSVNVASLGGEHQVSLGVAWLDGPMRNQRTVVMPHEVSRAPPAHSPSRLT